MTQTYPKRLIEVDLPIKRISAHARREKSIRHGHISTLHIWWARRPLAACRAVICAALWPDPADELCPASFRDKVRAEMLAWTPHERQRLLGEESRKRFEKARQNPPLFDDAEQLRGAILDFIADFANWDNSTVKEYLETSRALTQAAHDALGVPPHPLSQLASLSRLAFLRSEYNESPTASNPKCMSAAIHADAEAGFALIDILV